MMMKIRLRTGYRVKTDAETIYSELEAVRAENGGDIALQEVVDRSKPASAPLHEEFEWNNPKAANSWRLHQARTLVRSVEVIRDNKPTTRVYEAVEVKRADDDDEPVPKNVFRSIDDVMADPIARAELLSRAIREAVALRRRYANLQELAKVFAAIDEVLLKVEA